ncbi:hypothetical protein [Stratiformator vulcanicus]|uniref:Oligogalacturonide lyase n=1 Tax=Stratiformator vulcanicus TaxID=2527980 RepID=A0A517QYL5_9PLAN|nr:hypothetical protein [Stratiformator vulcanicus]QDT36735.1 hypothetical protein Pan189_10980 [Stratiformator vulcanicus]
MKRRDFLKAVTATSAGCLLNTTLPQSLSAESVDQWSLPTRVITTGPKHHWFGYYDKWQFDPTDRFVLSNEVSFEHRSPRESDSIGIGMVDTGEADRWIPLGTTKAWCWQQGCMLQWVPQREHTVLWNDREGDQFVCRILDTKSGDQRTVDTPIYSLAPDGQTAVTTDFRRIQDMRKGYGYAGLADPHRDELAPDDSGLWRVDLESGDRELVFSIAEAASTGAGNPSMEGAKHYFNHLLVSPDGNRTIFLHRWRPDGGRGKFRTRMFTIGLDGSDPYVLDPSGSTSHFIWRDDEYICAWTRPEGQPWGFYLFKDKTDEVEPVGRGVMTKNGHNTYLPIGDGTEWILNDTYPDRDRVQTVYLYHVPTEKVVKVGDFPSPRVYTGEWRCDTHPRYSRDGKTICVDSPVERSGRQLHLIDISEIVG